MTAPDGAVRPNPVPAIVVGSLSVPLLLRGADQWVAGPVAAMVVATVVVVIATGVRRWWGAAAAVGTGGVVGLVLSVPPSMVAYLVAVVAFATVATTTKPGDRRRRSVLALAVLAVGGSAASIALLASAAVALPAAVLGAAAGGAVVADLLVGAPRRWGLVDRGLDRAARWWAATAEPAPIAPSGQTGGGHRGWVVVALSAVALAVAWRQGRTGAAVVGAVVASLGVLACWYVPSWRHRTASAVDRLGLGVVRIVGFVVLAPIHLLVLTPIGWARRAFGRAPLDVRWRASSDSYWLASDGTSLEPLERMFANERAWLPVSPPPAAPRSTIVRTVVVVLVVQALAIGAVLGWRERTEPRPVYEGVSGTTGRAPAALAGRPWVDVASDEMGAAAQQVVYTSFTGWSLRDFEGRYVNVRDRVRASYEPPLAPGQEPLDIWFFGGSSLFGFDLQRDEHTIPSEVARLAEAAGIGVRVRNYGAPGYVGYQSAMLLSLLLSSGQRPDLVVFYDGANDVSAQLFGLFTQLDIVAQPTELHAATLRDALAESDLLPGLSAALPAPLEGTGSGPVPTLSTTAELVVEAYQQTVEVAAALGERYDVPIVHFWQPDAFSRRPLDPAEAQRLEQLGFEGDVARGMRRLHQAVRDLLGPEVVDLAHALDGIDGPVLTDSVHLNEEGGAAVAVAMYDTLGPLLTEQQASS